MRSTRKNQLCMLEALADAYPTGVAEDALLLATSAEEWEATIEYLKELELIKRNAVIHLDKRDSAGGYSPNPGYIITAKGIDLLENDGGLSAVINTTTVRLHADTIRELLSARIEASAMPTLQKTSIKHHLTNLSEKALWKLFEKLVDLGVDRIQEAIASAGIDNTL